MRINFIIHDLVSCLSHFIEECGEALAAAGKSFRFGLDDYNPLLEEDKRELYIDWLERELIDLSHTIENLKAQLLLSKGEK